MSLPVADYFLKDVEALYNDLLQTLPAIVYLAEPEPPFTTLFVSDKVNILGYTAEEWLGCADFWQTLIHPSDKKWVLQKTEEIREVKGTINLEYRVYGKGGKVFWVQEIGKFVLGESAKPIYRQGAFIDITAKKIAEIEREELLTKLHTALAEIKTLNGLIPICTCCSKVRNDQNYWQDLEKYMREKLTSKFSNSICPDCIQNVKNRLSGLTQRLQSDCTHPSINSTLSGPGKSC